MVIPTLLVSAEGKVLLKFRREAEMRRGRIICIVAMLEVDIGRPKVVLSPRETECVWLLGGDKYPLQPYLESLR